MSDPEAGARLLQALELHDLGVMMQRTRLQREHPDWSHDEVEDAVRRWLWERPGAEFGDYPGPPSSRRFDVG